MTKKKKNPKHPTGCKFIQFIRNKTTTSKSLVSLYSLTHRPARTTCLTTDQDRAVIAIDQRIIDYPKLKETHKDRQSPVLGCFSLNGGWLVVFPQNSTFKLKLTSVSYRLLLSR